MADAKLLILAEWHCCAVHCDDTNFSRFVTSSVENCTIFLFARFVFILAVGRYSTRHSLEQLQLFVPTWVEELCVAVVYKKTHTKIHLIISRINCTRFYI